MQEKGKGNKRENAQKQFLDALKESLQECYDQQLITNLSDQLESAVYAILKNDNSKEYREKINFLKMKLKGSQNQHIRQALFTKQIIPDQLANWKQEDFVLFQQNLKKDIGDQQPSVFQGSESLLKSIKQPIIPQIITKQISQVSQSALSHQQQLQEQEQIIMESKIKTEPSQNADNNVEIKTLQIQQDSIQIQNQQNDQQNEYIDDEDNQKKGIEKAYNPSAQINLQEQLRDFDQFVKAQQNSLENGDENYVLDNNDNEGQFDFDDNNNQSESNDKQLANDLKKENFIPNNNINVEQSIEKEQSFEKMLNDSSHEDIIAQQDAQHKVQQEDQKLDHEKDIKQDNQINIINNYNDAEYQQKTTTPLEFLQIVDSADTEQKELQQEQINNQQSQQLLQIDDNFSKENQPSEQQNIDTFGEGNDLENINLNTNDQKVETNTQERLQLDKEEQNQEVNKLINANINEQMQIIEQQEEDGYSPQIQKQDFHTQAYQNTNPEKSIPSINQLVEYKISEQKINIITVESQQIKEENKLLKEKINQLIISLKQQKELSNSQISELEKRCELNQLNNDQLSQQLLQMKEENQKVYQQLQNNSTSYKEIKQKFLEQLNAQNLNQQTNFNNQQLIKIQNLTAENKVLKQTIEVQAKSIENLTQDAKNKEKLIQQQNSIIQTQEEQLRMNQKADIVKRINQTEIENDKQIVQDQEQQQSHFPANSNIDHQKSNAINNQQAKSQQQYQIQTQQESESNSYNIITYFEEQKNISQCKADSGSTSAYQGVQLKTEDDTIKLDQMQQHEHPSQKGINNIEMQQYQKEASFHEQIETSQQQKFVQEPKDQEECLDPENVPQQQQMHQQMDNEQLIIQQCNDKNTNGIQEFQKQQQFTQQQQYEEEIKQNIVVQSQIQKLEQPITMNAINNSPKVVNNSEGSQKNIPNQQEFSNDLPIRVDDGENLIVEQFFQQKIVTPVNTNQNISKQKNINNQGPLHVGLNSQNTVKKIQDKKQIVQPDTIFPSNIDFNDHFVNKKQDPLLQNEPSGKKQKK